MPLAAAGFVKPGHYGNGLEQSRFAGAVFADDDGDRPIEVEIKPVAQERKAERISSAILDEFRIKPDSSQIWRRHIDSLASP